MCSFARIGVWLVYVCMSLYSLETTLVDHNGIGGSQMSDILTLIQGSFSVIMIAKHSKTA